MLKSFTILLGNGINNIENNSSWEQLVSSLPKFCKVNLAIDNERRKHFPLLYEEIFFMASRNKSFKETLLKNFIAKKIQEIQPHPIYKRIQNLKITDIITTNYDFLIEGITPSKNEGVISESKYSVFRHYAQGSKRVWHIHGDCLHPNSINLGFEHYGGQLQQVRNYTASGTQYKTKKAPSKPLIARLGKGSLTNHSWIDLFFTIDIHIVGLTLGFIETDLWWLLTYRARMKITKRGLINNKLYYYIPKKYSKDVKNKIDLLKALDVDVVEINKINGPYYNSILEKLERL